MTNKLLKYNIHSLIKRTTNPILENLISFKFLNAIDYNLHISCRIQVCNKITNNMNSLVYW